MSSVVSGAQSPPIVKSPLPPEIEELHASVVAAGQETYTDPATGYMVMSALYHTRRGYCCGNVCRHCPYNSMNVGKKKVDWVMADGTKYTAKKAAALTQLAKRANSRGGSPERKRGEDKDDNNYGCAGSSSGSSHDGKSSGNSSDSCSSCCSSNGSSTVAAEATKGLVTETTINCGGTQMAGSILPGTGPLPGTSGGCVLATTLILRPAALFHVGRVCTPANDAAGASTFLQRNTWWAGAVSGRHSWGRLGLGA
ncbi:hypothetical protein VYU27_008840 [Nannochloropsis oceanica]